MCRNCSLRLASSCPVMESCPTDVIRLNEAGMPYVAYPDDCMSCFLCQMDCPNGAVEVSAEIPLPFLPAS
ncbi:MAG: [Fe-S]-binding protein [Chloroflexi bacterium]|nr:[Fe-S]-binding protein [Chloroflexota bacterium]